MTTIVVRDGVMAGDTCATFSSDSSGAGDTVGPCKKIYRVKNSSFGQCLVGLAGDSMPGIVFLEWFKNARRRKPAVDLTESKFTALVLCADGLFEFDGWCVPDPAEGPFYAIGTGAKAAYGALHMGANAKQAVEVACKVDPYTRGPIITFTL